MDIQLLVIAGLFFAAVAIGAIAIVREVRNRKMDAHVRKTMMRE